MKDAVLKAVSLLSHNLVLRCFAKFSSNVGVLDFRSSKKHKKIAVFLFELHKALYLCSAKSRAKVQRAIIWFYLVRAEVVLWWRYLIFL